MILTLLGGIARIRGEDLISGPEREAIVDRMIDPDLTMVPQANDPAGAYPPGCEDNRKRREFGEQIVLDGKVPLPPLYVWPEGLKLRAEWFRRAEILKQEREKLRRHENDSKR